MTIDLTLRQSLLGLQWGVVIHAGLAVLLMASSLPDTPTLVALAGLAASWLLLRRNPALGFGPRALTRLIWHDDGSWRLQRADGRSFSASLSPRSVVTHRVLVLRFVPDDGRAAMTRLILGDETDADGLRRLRARLLVSGPRG